MEYLMGQDLKHPFYSGTNLLTRRLNKNTSFGLFISDGRNKYIVTEDFGIKVAIALKHTEFPRYSWFGLYKETVDFGHWQGPFWLSTTKAVPKIGVYAPGIIEVGDGFAGLDCMGLSGEVNSINLGYAGRRGSCFQEYEGWVIHTLSIDRTFFKSAVDRRCRWECAVGPSVILVHMTAGLDRQLGPSYPLPPYRSVAECLSPG